MKLGVSIQLLCELAPYALVGTTVFTAALGAPYLASLTGLVTLLLLVDMALSECDLAVRLLGDAPRGAYQGKVVWITGASQGLGEALALHLASLGARLILSSRREGVLAKVCAAATRSARRGAAARAGRARGRVGGGRGGDAGDGDGDGDGGRGRRRAGSITCSTSRGARSRARRRIPPRRWTATCSRSTSSARSRSRRRCCPACSRGEPG